MALIAKEPWAARSIRTLNELFAVDVLERSAASSLPTGVRSKKIAWGILSSRTRSLSAQCDLRVSRRTRRFRECLTP